MLHTAGPWKIYVGRNLVRIEAGYHSIATVLRNTTGRAKDDAQCLIDARLIATAPDLLKALKAVEWVRQFSNGGAYCPWCKGLYPDHEPICVRQDTIRTAEKEGY